MKSVGFFHRDCLVCAIIDANVASEVVDSSLGADAEALVDWVERGAGRIAYGGKNTEELFRNQRVRRWLLALARAGRARAFESAAISAETKIVDVDCVSNDAHIIALARVSGARILFSRDQNLHRDFRDPALVGTPRGGVYQGVEHAHLFRTIGCTC